MAKKTKHYFINWIDGMKINKDHFIGMENAMIYQQNIVDKFLINPYNFGILPGTGEECSLDILCKIDADNHVDISINRCLAITSGGFIIDLDTCSPELTGYEISLNNYILQISESSSGQFYIVLRINPYNHMPAGHADPAENPPRHPYVIPESGVFIVPFEQMNKAGFGDFFLVIGKLIIKDNIPILDKEYIPPCSRVSSDERLLVIESKIYSFFNKLESDIMIIIRKIHTKQQKSPLAGSVLSLADKILSFLAPQMTGQRLYLKHLPPVSLFEMVLRFACLLKILLNAQPPEQKEEMINYFSDWCNLTQGELEKLLIDTTNLNYNHNEISAVMAKLMAFSETMGVLFGTLSNLEYIGKRRDTQIYIKEEGKQKKSFLAD
ncbi:MAG: hypothetical protein WCE64_06940 [Bacteroidales bacterium]